MTRVQRIQLRQSELRSKLAAELDKPEGERTDGELERLTNQLNGLEVEFRAALAAEEEEQPAEEEEETHEDRGERELRERVSFSEYLAAAMSGAGVRDGAARELNQHMGLADDWFPLDVLAADVAEREQRAARDGDAARRQSSWIDRVFYDTAAAYLGVTMRSVQPGIDSVPQTTSTSAQGVPAQRGRTEDAGASTFSFGVTEIKPSRNAIHYEYTIEDDLRVPGLASAIQRDMRMAMTEKIDRDIFQGDSGANENSADITGLRTATITEETLTQANKVKGDKVLEMFAGLTDGRYATDIDDIAFVASVGTNRLWASTVQNSAAENQTVRAFLRENGLMWRTRGGIDTATANGDFGGYASLGNGRAGTAVAAVWNAGQLIRDPYSKAKGGQVLLTLNYLWNFAIIRAANWKRLKYVT